MSRRRWLPERRGRALAIAALVAASLLAAGTAEAGSGSVCIRVETDRPVLLPDGNLYPAGALTLCDTAKLSPVASLHKTYVNGHPVGILVSRRRTNETRGTEPPVVVFQREGRVLELVGYVLPAPRRSGITYVLNSRAAMPSDEVRQASQGGLSSSLVVLVATGAR